MQTSFFPHILEWPYHAPKCLFFILNEWLNLKVSGSECTLCWSPMLWPVCSVSSSHGCDCLITIYTHGFDFWSSSTPARDILTHGYCSVKSLCDILVPRQYSHIFSPLGFLDLDLLSCPCFIFSFFFLIRQLLLHQSSACQIACWCLEDLWTKQTKVPVLMEFVGSKSRFFTKYFF